MQGRAQRNLLKSERGMGLVEILVALSLLAVVVMAFNGAITQGAIISSTNTQENTALALAQQKMEEIKAVWPSVPSDFGKVTKDDNEYTLNGKTYENVVLDKDKNPIQNGTVFSRTWLYTPDETTSSQTVDNYFAYPKDQTAYETSPESVQYAPRYKKYRFTVTVTVTWDEHAKVGDIPHSISLVTYMTGR